MKNEWDLLAAIQRRLAAGTPVVSVIMDYPADGNEGRAVDDTGQVFVLAPEAIQQLIHELVDFVRSLGLPFSLTGEVRSSRTFRVGPGLPPYSQPADAVDLLTLGVPLSEYLGIQPEEPEEPDDSDHGEEWKRLL